MLKRDGLTLIAFTTVRVFCKMSASVPSRCVATEMCGLKFEFPKCPRDAMRAVSFSCPMEPADGHSHSEYTLRSIPMEPRITAKDLKESLASVLSHGRVDQAEPSGHSVQQSPTVADSPCRPCSLMLLFPRYVRVKRLAHWWSRSTFWHPCSQHDLLHGSGR